MSVSQPDGVTLIKSKTHSTEEIIRILRQARVIIDEWRHLRYQYLDFLIINLPVPSLIGRENEFASDKTKFGLIKRAVWRAEEVIYTVVNSENTDSIVPIFRWALSH